MKKSEPSKFQTSLSAGQVKQLLQSALAGSSIEQIESGPLDELADIAIVAERFGGALMSKSPFGPGLASVQIFVSDDGEHRTVELVALALSQGEKFASGWANQRAAGNGFEGLQRASAARRETPEIKPGRKMVAALVQAIRAADPGLRQVG